MWKSVRVQRYSSLNRMYQIPLASRRSAPDDHSSVSPSDLENPSWTNACMRRFIDHILETRCLSRMKLRMYGMKDLPQRQRYKEYCRVPQCHRVHGTTLSLNRL